MGLPSAENPQLPLATQPRVFFEPPVAHIQEKLTPDLAGVSQALIHDGVTPELANSFAITFYAQGNVATGSFSRKEFVPPESEVRYSSHVRMSLPMQRTGRAHDWYLWHEFGHLQDWATMPDRVPSYYVPKTRHITRMVGATMAGTGFGVAKLVESSEAISDSKLAWLAGSAALILTLTGAMALVVPHGVLQLTDRGEWHAHRYAFRHRKEKILHWE